MNISPRQRYKCLKKIEKCLTLLLVIREMQIKTIMRHFTPIRMASTKKEKSINKNV